MYDGKMTLDNLAVCMRGHARDSLIMIQTAGGLKHIKLVTGAYGSRDGIALPAGASPQSGQEQYIIVLHTTEP